MEINVTACREREASDVLNAGRKIEKMSTTRKVLVDTKGIARREGSEEENRSLCRGLFVRRGHLGLSFLSK